MDDDSDGPDMAWEICLFLILLYLVLNSKLECPSKKFVIIFSTRTVIYTVLSLGLEHLLNVW